MKVKFAEAI